MNILKIPFDGGSMGRNKGCANAPDAILKDFPDYSSENNIKKQIKILNVHINNSDFEETHRNIEKKVSELDEAVILGGDHSITYSALKGSKCDALIIMDAHPDCMDGTNIVTHEDFLKKIVKDGILPPQNIFLFGIRAWHSSEADFLIEKKIKFFDMKSIFEFGVSNLCDTLMEMARGFRRLYLSIDIDVLDPAFAPGTGFCEPGGLSSRELIYIIQRLKNLRNLKFIDIVEINPERDENEKSINIGKKIVIELS